MAWCRQLQRCSHHPTRSLQPVAGQGTGNPFPITRHRPMTQTIPDAKLHRLALTDFEVRQLINALEHYATGLPGRPAGAAAKALSLRSQLERSQPT